MVDWEPANVRANRRLGRDWHRKSPGWHEDSLRGCADEGSLGGAGEWGARGGVGELPGGSSARKLVRPPTLITATVC